MVAQSEAGPSPEKPANSADAEKQERSGKVYAEAFGRCRESGDQGHEGQDGTKTRCKAQE